MATINSYATLTDYKTFITAAGQTMSSDTADDGVIEDLLERASRYIDGQTGRRFYPAVETRVYDIPDGTNDDRLLMLDDNLLALTTFANGDGTEITSSDYKLLSYNVSPKWAIRLKDVSSVTWETDTTNSAEGVLSVAGIWGYHDQYTARGWQSGGVLDTSMDADTTTLTMTAGHTLVEGQIVKLDSEILNIATISSNTITPIIRGDNGSTAAAHTTGTIVNIWQVMEDVKGACLEIAANAYRRRFGENQSGQSVTTPAGLVIGPADVTETARKTMNRLARIF